MKHLLKIAALVLLLPVAAFSQSATGVGASGVSVGTAGSGGGGGGGGTPGGSDTQFQYNNAGSFGGTAGMTFNNGSGVVTMSNALTLNGALLGSVIVSPANGGTGVNNGTNTISLSGNFLTSSISNSYSLEIDLAADAIVPSSMTSFLAGRTSALLRTTMTDETGTGVLVFATSPVFTTDITLPNAAGPTTGSVAKTAFNTTAWAASRGAIQVHDGTANTYVVATLASDTPTNGQVPTWNTGGTITWETPTGGGGTPGGSDTQVQYNNSGSFGANAGLVADKTTGALTQTQNSLGATTLPGLTLTNTTAATNGTTQVSPAIYFSGQGYATTGGLNQNNRIRILATPVQGSTSTVSFTVQADAAGSGTFSTIGSITSSGDYASVSDVRAATGGALRFGTSRSRMQSGSDGTMSVTASNGTTPADVTMGNIISGTAGKGLQLQSGTGARAGNATLVGGTVTVTNTTVTTSTIILLTRKTAGGVIGDLTYTLSAGASFTITSSAGTDTSTVSYLLIELN